MVLKIVIVIAINVLIKLVYSYTLLNFYFESPLDFEGTDLIGDFNCLFVE